jgi:hypothetical protein
MSSRSISKRLASVLACLVLLLATQGGKQAASASSSSFELASEQDVVASEPHEMLLDKFRNNPNVWSALQEESEVKPDLIEATSASAAVAEEVETAHVPALNTNIYVRSSFKRTIE